MLASETTLPLPSLVGLDAAVRALLLLAVEPRLGGVVFAAPAGTGKSSLARGFAALCLTPAPFVELPASADEEALLGGLDLAATLRAGRHVLRSGLLARADGGALYADQLNLLPDATANLLLGALDGGEIRIERDGISTRAPARFTLLASYDPAEGQPRRHLLDRIGLWVALPAQTDVPTRTEVVRRNGLDGRRKTEDERRKYETPSSVFRLSSNETGELEALQNLVAAAREALPDVAISDDQLVQVAAAALAFGVEGHRADAFAAYAACAAAALGLRDEVEQADLELAVRLVIMPRATRMPEIPDDEQPTANNQSSTPQPEQQQQNDTQNEDSDAQHGESNAQGLPDDQVFAALVSELPAELERLPFKALRRGKTGSRGTVAGRRGRHIRSIPGDARRGKVDVSATLRAAAPWQQVRQQGLKNRALVLRAEDLRIKQFKSKAGALFLFAVDASGSMALHRMRQAKGAVHALLQKAYVHRDRVALLAFRGDRAELLLPPSQSVELARRAIDTLPTGGGTPIAAALLAALDVAGQARGRGIMQTVLVLLTDGRANIGLRGDRAGITEELRLLGGQIAEAGIHALVIDTQRSYLSRGEARTLASYLGGDYVYLPNAQSEQIASVVGDVVTR